MMEAEGADVPETAEALVCSSSGAAYMGGVDDESGAGPALLGGDAGQVGQGVENDPQYVQAQALAQRGQWAEAQAAFAELQARYPNSIEVRSAQQELALHLSAEHTWAAQGKRPRMQPRLPRLRLPHRRVLRLLIVANAVLYVLVGLLWLLLRIGRP